MLLAPLDQTAFIIGLGKGQLVDIEETPVYIIDKQTIDELVTLVEIHGPHHSLERIAEDMLLDESDPAVGNDMPVEPDMHGQRVERLPRDDAGPHLGEEPLVVAGKLDEQEIGGDGLDDGIAQKLEPLVVDGLPVLQNQRS